MSHPFVDTTMLEKDIGYDGGTVKVKFVRITRLARNAALEKAVLAYQRDHPGSEEGWYPHVFERELVAYALKWWSFGVDPQIGWDLLDGESDVGDKIAEAIGVKAARESLAKRSKEIEKAKNLPTGGQETTTPS